MRTSRTRWNIVALTTLLSACATTHATNPDEAKLKGDVASLQQRLDSCAKDLEKARADAASLGMVEQRMKAYRQIAEKLRSAFDPGSGLKLEIRDGLLVLHMPEHILFNLGSFELKPAGVEVLRKLAPALSEVKGRDFLVAGYTDNTPVKKDNKSYHSNWDLSALRALAVLHELTKLHVSPQSIAATGFGEYHPVASNDSEAGRAENRRTEIIFMPTIDELPKIPGQL